MGKAGTTILHITDSSVYNSPWFCETVKTVERGGEQLSLPIVETMGYHSDFNNTTQIFVK